MAAPNTLTETETSGSGSRPISVSRGSIDSISTIATTNTSVVCDAYMIDGPAIIRTAFRSLVARDIRSPVRWRRKYSGGSRCRCAKKSLRRSYSISRDTPMMMRRIRKRNTPPAAEMANSTAAYMPSLPRVTLVDRSSTAYFSTHGASS